MNPAVAAEVALFMLAHEPEPEHVRQVAMLALALFDQLRTLHGLGPAERDLLEAAALLHDTGWSVARDGKGHHKESARLIASFPWETLDQREVAIVAQTARYHRKSLPGPSHDGFMALAEKDRVIVFKLAALLRVADGLDRQHLTKVAAVAVKVAEEVVTLTVQAKGDVSAELAAAAEKADLAERVFGRRFAFATERA